MKYEATKAMHVNMEVEAILNTESVVSHGAVVILGRLLNFYLVLILLIIRNSVKISLHVHTCIYIRYVDRMLCQRL